MRFWGEIVSPSPQASPIKAIEGLWPNGLPTFEDGNEANAFFQALIGLWNNVARFQDGSLKLQKIDKTDSREGLHAAAKLRVEELYRRLHAGLYRRQSTARCAARGQRSAWSEWRKHELLATTRNTFAKPLGPEDAAILAELRAGFPEIDRAVHADLNAIAVAAKNCRKEQLGTLRSQATTRGNLH